MISHSANSSINISPQHKLVPGTNPWLSSIPRSMGLVDGHIPQPHTWGNTKRRVDEVDADDEYDGEESASVTDDKDSGDEKGSDKNMEDADGSGGAEKKAAWLLMKLSVKDGECGQEAMEVARERETLEGPRVKRRRATSM
jgi:hypothetical protein